MLPSKVIDFDIPSERPIRRNLTTTRSWFLAVLVGLTYTPTIPRNMPSDLFDVFSLAIVVDTKASSA